MPTYEIIIAGFGGQGVMFLGEILAHAALHEGYEVTWLPSYGPEQRGGTAHCTVVISDRPVASPVVADPSILIALNRPSLDRFEPAVRPGGLIVCDVTMTGRAPARPDAETVCVPATAIANDLGAARVANMVILGALLAAQPILSQDSIRAALETKVRDPQARARNLDALARGAQEVASHVQRAS
ncbi:MAG: 2-oxoacid:acceptor oxidoreductase family protein [Armatimonadota bacterium]|nr:2-oxoacid:acceptor oxidoreductase family protein [Armatimonadota bacterium]